LTEGDRDVRNDNDLLQRGSCKLARAMMLHALLGRHAANLRTSHWDDGRFVSHCVICGREMVKPPGGLWGIAAKSRGRDAGPAPRDAKGKE